MLPAHAGTVVRGATAALSAALAVAVCVWVSTGSLSGRFVWPIGNRWFPQVVKETDDEGQTKMRDENPDSKKVTECGQQGRREEATSRELINHDQSENNEAMEQNEPGQEEEGKRDASPAQVHGRNAGQAQSEATAPSCQPPSPSGHLPSPKTSSSAAAKATAAALSQWSPFASATTPMAARPWTSSPMSPSSWRSAPGQAVMSANEKRDLDMMIRHQERQEGRPSRFVDLDRAKARLRRRKEEASSTAVPKPEVVQVAVDEIIRTIEMQYPRKVDASKKARKKVRNKTKCAQSQEASMDLDGTLQCASSEGEGGRSIILVSQVGLGLETYNDIADEQQEDNEEESHQGHTEHEEEEEEHEQPNDEEEEEEDDEKDKAKEEADQQGEEDEQSAQAQEDTTEECSEHDRSGTRQQSFANNMLVDQDVAIHVPTSDLPQSEQAVAPDSEKEALEIGNVILGGISAADKISVHRPSSTASLSSRQGSENGDGACATVAALPATQLKSPCRKAWADLTDSSEDERAVIRHTAYPLPFQRDVEVKQPSAAPSTSPKQSFEAPCSRDGMELALENSERLRDSWLPATKAKRSKPRRRLGIS